MANALKIYLQIPVQSQTFCEEHFLKMHPYMSDYEFYMADGMEMLTS